MNSVRLGYACGTDVSLDVETQIPIKLIVSLKVTQFPYL